VGNKSDDGVQIRFVQIVNILIKKSVKRKKKRSVKVRSLKVVVKVITRRCISRLSSMQLAM